MGKRFNRLLRRPMENYHGRHCGCPPATHARLVEMILRHVPSRSGVVDLGAHSGALLLRLAHAGFDDLVGVDLDPTRFDVPDAVFHRAELNQPFENGFERKFDLVTATEVIEHMDSPRTFLRSCRHLLRENGHLAITLPNVAFWEGRLKFALKGELWGFGARNYRTQRHISPITFEQMTLMMQEIGLHVVEAGTAGSFATPLRSAVTLPLWAPLRLVGSATTIGESALYLARRVEPDADLTRPIHYRKRWQGIVDTIGIDDEA